MLDLMFSSEEAPANHSRSQDFAKDWLTRVEISASPTLLSLIAIAPSGFSSRMSPDFCRVTEDEILEPSLGRWGNSGMGGVTGFSMHNMCEYTALDGLCLSDEGVCSLSEILETGDVPPQYYLSAKACRGILRRAARRGKELPPPINARTSGGGGLGTDVDCDGGLITSHEVAQSLLAKANVSFRADAESYVASTLDAHYGEKQGLDDQHVNGGGGFSSPSIAMCLNGHSGPMGRMDAESETLIPLNRCFFDDASGVAHTLRGEGFDASEDGGGKGTPLIAEMVRQQGSEYLRCKKCRRVFLADETEFGCPYCGAWEGDLEDPKQGLGAAIAFDTTQITSKTNRCKPQPGDACHPLAAGAHAPAIAFDWRASPSRSMNPGTISDALSGRADRAVASGYAVRRLMPPECEALQGFPRGYTNIPWRGKLFAPDGPRYKALGNSMAVNVMRWLGTRIQMVSDLVSTQATGDAA